MVGFFSKFPTMTRFAVTSATSKHPVWVNLFEKHAVSFRCRYALKKFLSLQMDETLSSQSRWNTYVLEKFHMERTYRSIMLRQSWLYLYWPIYAWLDSGGWGGGVHFESTGVLEFWSPLAWAPSGLLRTPHEFSLAYMGLLLQCKLKVRLTLKSE